MARALAGKIIEATKPPVDALAIAWRPLCCSAANRAIGKPSQRPLCARSSPDSAWLKGHSSFFRSFFIGTIALIANSDHDLLAHLLSRNLHRAAKRGELHRVIDKGSDNNNQDCNIAPEPEWCGQWTYIDRDCLRFRGLSETFPSLP